MLSARDDHLRVREHRPFERRQLGIVGGVVSGVLSPLLGAPTTTQTPPAQTTTSAASPATTTPSPAGNTTPANGGANPLASPNPGTSIGNNSGASTPTGTVFGPSGSTIRAAGGTPSDTASGGTTSGDPSSGSTGSGTGTDSGRRGGSSGSSSGGSSYSTSGSGTPGNGDSSPSPSDVNSKDDKSHAGPIAAAVILTLLFGFAVVLFILRRRSRARRDDQANKWWFTRKRTSQTYGDNEALHTGNSSRRSSFATTIDHSNRSLLANTDIPPPPPPMAEVGRSKGTAPALVLNINADQDRFSIGSAGSHSSQFLIIHHRESLLHEATTSACTESFPFPKPPIVDRASLYSKASDRSQSELRQDGDPLHIKSPSSRSLTLLPTQPLLPSDPFADKDPFEDPASTPTPVTGQHLTGTVRRPFSPQLQDELRVDIGESLRILQSFDDGWALAEKMAPSIGEQGFVPLECFHEVGQPSSGRTRGSSHGTESI